MSKDIEKIVSVLRKGITEGVLNTLESRKCAIRNILKLFLENEEDIVKALEKDLRRCRTESILTDIDPSVGEAKTILSNMDSWLKEESVPSSFITLMDTVTIQKQPYGVVLIISPWNFPFILSFQPLIGAIAAGNSVLLKPSELTPACSQLIGELIPKYLDKPVLKERIEETIKQFLGDNPQKCPDFARIVNVRHFQRLTDLLKQTKGKVMVGGMSDVNDKYFAPTVVFDVDEEDILMQDEIFGPILPVLSVKSPSEAIRIINSKEKPLAIYVFTRNKSVFDDFKMATSSGAIMMNDCTVHTLIPNIPFGGIGHSGIGNYHGRYSIETFSHRRPVILKSEVEYINNKIRYYPYTESGLSWLRWSLKKSDRNGCQIL
ncbi:Aldehyde dehydrogenase, variant 5 [Schistosoma haematobium]|uniref:Aldehyde dehydrogenase, variant 5 n=1 Tax=Schistosoma haematobium TaxID=6185 RepID=A0A922LNJ6_SCHHA|nr:Aldehyde dehydrogenase, variant 5 [Schistosoma haematobium]KAH9590356.1 Aldehyde dehydrogenase, variant 5 [Schistosoma haematobium]